MGELPIHYVAARKMLRILGAAALGTTMIGVGIAIIGGPVGWVTGGPAAFFFAACTGVIFYRALAEAPVLSLTHEGVQAWRYPFLRWEEIDFAEVAPTSGQMFLVLHAKDHAAYVARFSFFKRKWAQLNRALMQGSVYLTVDMFAVPAADVAHTINAELARRRRGNHTPS